MVPADDQADDQAEDRPGSRPRPRRDAGPDDRPATRPTPRPGDQPDDRPGSQPGPGRNAGPDDRPATRPTTPPGGQPDDWPDDRPEDQAADLTLLTEAAFEAGAIARRFWRQAPRVWDKPGNLGPVSEADLAVNDHLGAVLRRARPDYGWLSEESPDDGARLAAGRVFVLDPIDGTRAFIDGQEGFSHALAVVDAGQVIAAVVHLPVLGLTYSATRTGPARLNGAVIAPSRHGLHGATVLANKASMAGRYWRGGVAPDFTRVFRPSLAWRLCLAAQGRFDAALTLRPAWEWDIAAASLIAARAGAAVSDRHGAPMRFNNPLPQVDGLVVAGPPLHQALLAALVPGDAAG